MKKTPLERNAERKRVNRAMCRPSLAYASPMTITTIFAEGGETTGRQRGCLSLLKARVTPSFQVHSGGFHHRHTIAPTNRPSAFRTSLLPFGLERHAPRIANSILLPHSCAEDDQVHPSVFPEGIRRKETATGAVKTAGPR